MNRFARQFARIAAAVTSIAALGLAAACGGASSAQSPTTEQPQTLPAEAAPIEIVATINQWGSLAKQIGGDYANVTSILASSNVDAHDFEPQGSDVAKLSKASIVVANGAGYDSWASKAVGKNTVLVSAAETIGASDGDNPHLWFSKDARSAMAKELADACAKLRPDHKDYFQTQLKQWQTGEQTLEETMGTFSSSHKGASYAATESVAKYLLADLGMKDVTPKGYEQASANGGESSPSDLNDFTRLIESHAADVVVNNPQETSDTTNMITGVAHKSDVPVVDVTEQMPEGYATLDDWISALVESFDGALGGSSATGSPEPSSGASGGATPSSSSAAASEGSADTGTQPDPGK